MRQGLLLLIVLQLALACPAGAAARESLQLESIQVEDGDTLILAIDGREERLQLAHIDAPEDSDNAKLQHDIKRTGMDRDILIELGLGATTHLGKLSRSDAGPFLLVYDPERRDRYGRLVVEVTDAGGRSLGAAMVEDGFARVLPARSPTAQEQAPLKVLETDAIASNRGLWGTHREAALAWKRPAPK